MIAGSVKTCCMRLLYKLWQETVPGTCSERHLPEKERQAREPPEVWAAAGSYWLPALGGAGTGGEDGNTVFKGRPVPCSPASLSEAAFLTGRVTWGVKSGWVAKMFDFPSCVVPVHVGAFMRDCASLDLLTPVHDKGRLLPALTHPRTIHAAGLVNCYGPMKSSPLNVTYPGTKMKTG